MKDKSDEKKEEEEVENLDEPWQNSPRTIVLVVSASYIISLYPILLIMFQLFVKAAMIYLFCKKGYQFVYGI